MQITEGKCVVFGAAEICRIRSIETKRFDGIGSREYCVLSPINSESSTYYVPLDSAESRLREPLTKERVLELIDGLDGSEGIVFENGADRKAVQNEILSGGDHRKIMGLGRAHKAETNRRASIGKRPLASDEKAIKAAETLINREFGFVLGIDENKVGEFIRERLGETAEG